MANWAKLQEDLTGLPVVKRARHGIHFDKGNGEIVANFSGKPCHYEDKGVWKPIDTTLLLGADGFYGCPHSPVKVHKDGRVKVDKSDYSQFTKLPGSPVGKVDGDRIVREFPGGRQYLYVTEDGFREEIVVDKPTFPLEKFLAKQSGTLPSAYKASPQTAVDANGDVFEITSDTKAFGNWLNKAAYPVVIDPDFTGGTGDLYIGGSNADYATARSTYAQKGNAHVLVECGQYISTTFRVRRLFFLFDTSTIGAGSTVTQANLNLSWAGDQSLTDFDLQIVEATWDYTDAGTSYDNCLAGDTAAVWKNTSSLGTQHVLQASPNLTTSWVSKTGTTYYSLRSSRDKAGTEPSGNEYVTINMADNLTESRRPTLTVTYTAAASSIINHVMHYRRLMSR
jgi:hypothetical protein